MRRAQVTLDPRAPRLQRLLGPSFIFVACELPVRGLEETVGRFRSFYYSSGFGKLPSSNDHLAS
jgi:hypothetical protein